MNSSTGQILSKWVAIVLVLTATRACDRARSPRSSCSARSAYRAWVSRSGQVWQGCRRSAVPEVLDPRRPVSADHCPACGTRCAAEVDLGQLGPEGGRRGCDATPASLGLEVLRHLHPAGHRRRRREVDERQPSYLPILGQHQRSRRFVDGHRLPGSMITAQPWLRAARHPDDVTRLQGAAASASPRPGDRRSARGSPRPRAAPISARSRA